MNVTIIYIIVRKVHKDFKAKLEHNLFMFKCTFIQHINSFRSSAILLECFVLYRITQIFSTGSIYRSLFHHHYQQQIKVCLSNPNL